MNDNLRLEMFKLCSGVVSFIIWPSAL